MGTAAAAGAVMLVAMAVGDGNHPEVVVRGDGAPAGQVRELRRILRGFPQLEITRTVIGRPPFGSRMSGRVWIYYEVRAMDDVEYVHGHWQGLVASGLLRAVGRTKPWPNVRGHTFSIVLPDGTKRFDSESVIGDAFRQTVRRASDERLRAILQRTSAAAGVSLESVRFARPLGRLVPEITVATHDPEEFVRNADEKVLAIMRPITRAKGGPLSEGAYVYVKTDQGQWVMASGYAVRVAGGVSATNPAFSGASFSRPHSS